ncbi:MAG TPA: hypothetical protein VGO37_18710 [Steroidobacteraceae bacterium]|jgi:hypothetical protein|nr:hypothetical protein [Steroidobacteraceae bacterium]
MSQIAYPTAGNGTKSLLASIVRLNNAYESDRLDGYKALLLKDSNTEKTTCNVQWGPMMRT